MPLVLASSTGETTTSALRPAAAAADALPGGAAESPGAGAESEGGALALPDGAAVAAALGALATASPSRSSARIASPAGR